MPANGNPDGSAVHRTRGIGDIMSDSIGTRAHRGIVARGNGTWSAVIDERIRPSDADGVGTPDGPTGSVRVGLSASAARFDAVIARIRGRAAADDVVAHAARACHAPYVASDRATTANRRRRLYDADIMAACGFVGDAADDAYRVFGIGRPSAPDASHDPAAYVTADGRVTNDADAARASWRDAAAAA